MEEVAPRDLPCLSKENADKGIRIIHNHNQNVKFIAFVVNKNRKDSNSLIILCKYAKHAEIDEFITIVNISIRLTVYYDFGTFWPIHAYRGIVIRVIHV